MPSNKSQNVFWSICLHPVRQKRTNREFYIGLYSGKMYLNVDAKWRAEARDMIPSSDPHLAHRTRSASSVRRIFTYTFIDLMGRMPALEELVKPSCIKAAFCCASDR